MNRLQLDENSLTGNIPPSLGNLVHLKHLYVRWNPYKKYLKKNFKIIVLTVSRSFIIYRLIVDAVGTAGISTTILSLEPFPLKLAAMIQLLYMCKLISYKICLQAV